MPGAGPPGRPVCSPRPGSPSGGLTPGERRVAELAAAGLSNKQIAARLYLSAGTVEVQLSRVYAKLGIRSRAQLARRLGVPAKRRSPARPAGQSYRVSQIRSGAGAPTVTAKPHAEAHTGAWFS